ncbi:nitrate- and nitrite sensing domain-containing protein [Micromonospora sp. NBC_01796]|uniref:nitrate- and nitrite sensing domain-containing protein n=1 Tax=Micromonospora sp. NBC_01796 TaxID=2975987 RepID=UPI003FA3993A
MKTTPNPAWDGVMAPRIPRGSSANLRTKVVALLVSLTALWVFAAWVTLREGTNLLFAQALNVYVYEPSEPLLQGLQDERRLSLAYLGAPKAAGTELDAARTNTRNLAAEFRQSAQGRQADVAGSSELKRRVGATVVQLDELDTIRTQVDARTIDRGAAAAAYTDVVDGIFRVYDALGSLDDETIATQAAALIDLNRQYELISQEDALVTGILSAGRITPAESAEVAKLVGAQRFMGIKTVSDLERRDRARYDEMLAGDAFVRLHGSEDRLILGTRTGTAPPIKLADWQGVVEPALQQLHDVVVTGGDGIVERSTPGAIWVIVRILLAAVLGAFAVIASVIVSVTTARALVAQLERLREAARTLANERLPGVVERLGRGEDVDVSAEAPPLDFGNDEIGQVGQAFNAVQETAIRTAVEQAELRRSVRDIFLSLARRTQALVHRQLILLDAMERRENDAEELEDLFRVDHLATRMRRNAENLIVLSGSKPGRAWRRNVPMVDVVRGAVAEVEDYTRVTVLPMGSVALAGRAVGDVIHLLAELIENGLSFSPPHTGVEVKGQMVANGFVVEIEDRGLGMTEEDLAAANDQIVSQQEFNLANATRLGLYVVSRLTERHGVRAHLKESPYGGTTAVVLIPLSLVTDTGAEQDQPESEPARPAPTGVAPNVRVGATTVGGGADHPSAPAPMSWGPGPAVADETDPPPPLPARSARPPLTTQRMEALIPHQRSGSSLSQASPAVERPGVPAVEDQPAATTPEKAAQTPSGLPVRVRQANLAKPLQDEDRGTPVEADDVEAPRPPEQVRSMMSSYQSGTRRGRSDAARLTHEEAQAQPAAADGADDEPRDQPRT